MTKDQIREAITQMKTHCEIKMPAYEMISARGALYELGFHGEDAEEVLEALFEGGFTYCLDPHFHRSPRADEGPISADVCYWGPDQLLSRLDCVHV